MQCIPDQILERQPELRENLRQESDTDRACTERLVHHSTIDSYRFHGPLQRAPLQLEVFAELSAKLSQKLPFSFV